MKFWGVYKVEPMTYGDPVIEEKLSYHSLCCSIWRLSQALKRIANLKIVSLFICHSHNTFAIFEITCILRTLSYNGTADEIF